MELVAVGAAAQALALALLLVACYGGLGPALRVRQRSDGRTEQVPDQRDGQLRQQLIRASAGLFVGGTLLVLFGLPRF